MENTQNGNLIGRIFFWSCGHCNGIKNSGKYDEGIIDCCRQDPEEYLSFRLKNDEVIIHVANLEGI